MKIFLDTNIFLDVILKREEYYADSGRVWSLVSEKKIKGYISAISINNIYYILSKSIDTRLLEGFIIQLLDEFTIIPPDKEILFKAILEDIKGYEDAIQFVSALRSGSGYLITRNIRDFPKNKLEIIRPSSFLKKITAQ